MRSIKRNPDDDRLLGMPIFRFYDKRKSQVTNKPLFPLSTLIIFTSGLKPSRSAGWLQQVPRNWKLGFGELFYYSVAYDYAVKMPRQVQIYCSLLYIQPNAGPRDF